MNDQILRHTPQLCGLAQNPALPPHLLDRFLALADGQLCAELAYRDDLRSEQARLLAHGGSASAVHPLVNRDLVSPADVARNDPWVVLALIEHPDADPSCARELTNCPDSLIRSELATRHNLPADVVSLLAHDKDVDVVASIARCQPLPVELAEELARHPHAAARAALARNEHAPPALLVALLDNGGRPPLTRCHACQGEPDRQSHRVCEGMHAGAVCDIQLAVAENPTTPSTVLTGFEEHPSFLIRNALAHRVDLPQQAYRHLAEDPMPGIRWDLASNPAVGEPLLRKLAAESTREIRRHLAHNPAISLDLLAHLSATTRIGPTLLPRIATATEAELRTLAASTTMQARMLVAERQDLPQDLIDRLATDHDPSVAKSIAPNPAITIDQLWTLTRRHGQRLYPRIARNPNCSPQLLHHLALNAHSVQKAYREIAKHPNTEADTLLVCLQDPDARHNAASHPNLPSKTIADLLNDPHPGVAEAAAANPSLPVTTMEELLTPTPV